MLNNGVSLKVIPTVNLLSKSFQARKDQENAVLKHQANSAQQEKFVSDGEICNVILASKPAQPKIINDAKIVVKETWNQCFKTRTGPAGRPGTRPTQA
jgi:hypothetical protein